jgi:hypothetical protein
MDSEVASIVAFYCEILLGKAHPSLGLACRENLEHQRLDYSLESLRVIDEYLLSVHRKCNVRPISELANTVMSVAFYVGEVIRRTTPQTQCRWTHAATAPSERASRGLTVANIGELALHGIGIGAAVIPADAVAQVIRNGASATSIYNFAGAALKMAWNAPSS